MISYQTKTKKLPGTSYSEVRKEALVLFNQIKKRTKRRPYIRSAYFKKQKIFFDYFWVHLNQKRRRERQIRLQLFAVAVEVIKNSRNAPVSNDNPANRNEILHRFAGLTKDKRLFYVQIKEDKRRDHKYFMSAFWAKDAEN
jgi:hypothetical protein